ncbi:MAG TPA: LON peptidase substrate-binding domain-containing protein [Alphaproteobacteria bacterium]|mgnify:CR=1 FL=1|nr:LON peptidase substrate-binding domain-containing protein [Alphaproteobacteria bacterium]
MKNASAPFFAFDSLPSELAVFPLSGVLLLPRGQLPLHIFEPRYVAMVEDTLKTADRLIGIIQPAHVGSDILFPIGCAGRITAFEEQAEGRFIITLTGLCRFRVAREGEPSAGGYRRVTPEWAPYRGDLMAAGCLDLDRDRLTALLRVYLSRNEMTCAWESIARTPDERLMTCLSMICPFEPQEKQALLEAPTCRDRAALFMTLLEIAVQAKESPVRH